MKKENSLKEIIETEELVSFSELKKEVSYKELENAYLLFKLKYPKLFLLTLSIIFAYILFKNPFVAGEISNLTTFGYASLFFVGMILAFGFTAPFAVGFLLLFQPSNFFQTVLIVAAGSTFADILIFRFIRFSFQKEFLNLKKERPLKRISHLIEDNLGLTISNYFLYIFAGILIASPLPDEIAVVMVAGLTKINSNVLAIISFLLHTIGILIILLI